MTDDIKTNSPTQSLSAAWAVWGLAALFYLMAFFHRVAPAVMTGDLMRDFGISAAALGNLAAYYFYSYVAMQIPTGILADLWGPRRLLSTGAFVAAAGTLLFAFAPTAFWAGMGRLLIGGSVAVAFVGLLKLSSSWFPVRYYAMVSGMAVFVGIIGAVFAGAPLRLLMDAFGWRNAMILISFMTLGVGLAIRGFVRDYPHDKGGAEPLPVPGKTSAVSRRAIFSGIAAVFRYRNTILFMVIPGALAGSILTFCGLWGVPYLATHQGISVTQAAFVTTGMMVALALGSPLSGWLTDRWGRRKPLFIIGCGLSLISLWTALFVTGIPFFMLVLLLLLAGLSSSVMIIVFAFAKESVPARFSGTISGVVNMGVMTGPMVLQPAVGWILDHHWQGRMEGGVRIYGLEAYRAGFSLLVIWIALSFLLLFFTRETHCRQTEEQAT